MLRYSVLFCTSSVHSSVHCTVDLCNLSCCIFPCVQVKHGRTHSLDGAKFSSFPYHSGLINGRGRYYSSMKPVEVKFKAPLEVFPVASNRVYRFRVISAASNFPFRVSVQGHRIEVSGARGGRKDGRRRGGGETERGMREKGWWRRGCVYESVWMSKSK